LELFRSLQQLRDADLAGSSLCIGVFDGVHRGHRMLLAAAIDHGRRLGLPALALTFSNHPLTLLAPPYTPPLLTTAEEKVALLAACGIDLCLMLEFDAALAATPPRDFLEQVVAGICRARLLVCGHDFRFGARGTGDVPLLRALGPPLGFEIAILDDLLDGNAPVRSSRVRARLLDGDVEEARRLLGRPYALSGRVVPGERRGRIIGFPTANLDPPATRLVPRNGVYVVAVDAPGRRLGGMLNIGVRPTFHDGERTVEVHLLDFDGDLYGHDLTVYFFGRIRDEWRFASVDELVAQLRRDEAVCRSALKSTNEQRR
jgi:riboflavin kinase/FMN adenylyltransferase